MHPIHPDRLRDILDLLIAQIVEGQRQLVANLIPNNSREADRTGIGQGFQPRRDVDAVAEQIVAVDHDIANMDADAVLHRLVGRTTGILGSNRPLHRHGALHGIDRAGEVGDDAVAGGVEDAAPMRRDQLIDDGAASLQPGERADLVARHQPAVAGNVGGEDCGEFALYRLNGHAWPPGLTISSRAAVARSFKLRSSVPGRTGLIVCFPAARFAQRRGHEGQIRVGPGGPIAVTRTAASGGLSGVQVGQGEPPGGVASCRS
jgi:hypothetical protein